MQVLTIEAKKPAIAITIAITSCGGGTGGTNEATETSSTSTASSSMSDTGPTLASTSDGETSANTTDDSPLTTADESSTGNGDGTGSTGDTGDTPPPMAGWTLSESTVGLAGVGLSCDELPLYAGPSKPDAGTIIEMQKITLSELDLSNGDITLDRVCVQPTSAGNRGSIVFGYNPDFGDDQLGPVTIRDSDIDGSLASNDIIYAACGFRGAGTLYRNNIWGMGSGICYFGSPSVPEGTIEHNFVHDLRGGLYGEPPQQSHNESATIRSFSGASLVWRNNKLISDSGSDSGALFIQTYAGAIENVVIEGNYFESLGWGMPLEAGYGNTYSNMQATNNRFVLSGFGAAYVTDGPGWAVWSDNFVYDETAEDAAGEVVDCPGGECA
jgi:hypothetical protein